MNFHQPDFNQLKRLRNKRYMSVMFFVLAAMAVIYGASKVGLGGNQIDVANGDNRSLWNKVSNIFAPAVNTDLGPKIEDDPDYQMPKVENDRWDLLVMGIRGEDTQDADETGALLTDTILLFSYDKTTGKASMVSIPRDLYVRIYGYKRDKINSAYEIGLLNKNGIGFTKKLFSRITGVYIDSAIVIDFSSFKEIIDQLGGVDVTLDKPFSEKQQWGYEFSLPAGVNHLDGDNALYYVRSRFSSSDFDRAQRQQKVILAVKDKVAQLNILTDPIKTLSILNTIRKNVDTDLAIWDAGSLLNLSKQLGGADSNLKRYVISTDNLLYESHVQTDVGNQYILLPNGDNLQGIKQFFQDVVK